MEEFDRFGRDVFGWVGELVFFAVLPFWLGELSGKGKLRRI